MGMRGAYYLYPYNVYWSMHSPEMPPFYFLRSGDYIVLIKPTTTHFNRHRNTLTTSENPPSSAESVFRDRTGELVRLN
jgi:hypothetical protein